MQIQHFILRITDMGKLAEIRCNFGKMINLFNQCFCHTGCKFFYIWRITGICFLKILNAQFHGCQWIFDFMGYLPGHFTPRSFTLTFRQRRCTFHQLGHHLVVFPDQSADFIILLPFNQFIGLAEVNLSHFFRYQGKGSRDSVREEYGDGSCNQENKYVQVDDRNQEPRYFIIEFIFCIKGRDIDICR